MNIEVISPFKNNSRLSLEGIISIQIIENIPILRASSAINNRINELIEKQKESELNLQEEEELDCYEEIDDYLSFINQTIRNLNLEKNQK
ncbi:MAG: hypothetical protein IGQ45_04195 [Cyanobacterium sp. T60_A2020_053]|nr:hypothetical protein [Cyanobacterium sp. T60_A2020_053]